jgi:hypothetical protein
MKANRTDPTRCFVAVLALSVAIGVAGRVVAQEPPSGAAEQQQRIEQLEKQLEELSKAVNEIKLRSDAERAKPAATKTKEAESAPEAPVSREKEMTLDPKWLGAVAWRSIGPANMSGRIVDLAVVESEPTTYWVATASGGLIKTTNNGVTYVHQFDREATVSIGSVAVAPSDPNIVWVGTGENNPRNSVSYGDGVYKSIDGGRSWKNMGLKKTFQIGRMAIHRTNPNVVYVGALGRLYGPNEERGLYRTTGPASSTCRCTRPIRTRCSLRRGSGCATGTIPIRVRSPCPTAMTVTTPSRNGGPAPAFSRPRTAAGIGGS